MTASVLTPAEWQAQPWANGRGITHELGRWRDGLLVSPSEPQYDVRIAVAEIRESAPFSRFTGYDRWFAPMGAVTLVLPDGAHPLALGDAHTFSGDVDAHGIPTAGPLDDLNLMVRRGLVWSARVTRTPTELLMLSQLAVVFVLAGAARVDLPAGSHDLGARHALLAPRTTLAVEPIADSVVAIMSIV